MTEMLGFSSHFHQFSELHLGIGKKDFAYFSSKKQHKSSTCSYTSNLLKIQYFIKLDTAHLEEILFTRNIF